MVKTLASLQHAWIRPILAPEPSFLLCCPRRQFVMAQAIGFLLPVWEIWVAYPAAGRRLAASALAMVFIWGMNQWMWALSSK